MIRLFFSAVLLVFAHFSFAQYPPAAGFSGSTAIHKDSAIISGWATNCIVTRGFINIEDTLATFTIGGNTSNHAFSGEDSLALGYPFNAGAVSLGDGGSAIISFAKPIKNGEGPDFAVFENGFQSGVPPYLYFLELAFVEVSSDGEYFVRFPSFSITQDSLQIDSYGQINPEQIHNLAGKYVAGYGTPFDLEDLKDSTGININRVTHIRLIDVCGTINSGFASLDSEGRIINDPFPTAFASGGFDLAAIAAINFVDDEGVHNPDINTLLNIYPNPFVSGTSLVIELPMVKPFSLVEIAVFDISGKILCKTIAEINSDKKHILNINLKPGLYFIKAFDESKIYSAKLLVN